MFCPIFVAIFFNMPIHMKIIQIESVGGDI